MKSKKNRNDFVLILVLLAVILIGFLVMRLQRQKDAFTVDVSVNGTTVATYRLDEEIDTWIDGYQGDKIICGFKMDVPGSKRQNCPDKLCVKQEPFQRVGNRWFACRIGWLWQLNRYGLPTRDGKRPSGYA